MHDNTRGGDDTLIGSDISDNNLRGDASDMDDDSRGGNDTLTGGDGSINFFNGDADTMCDDTRGGNDTLIGGDGVQTTASSATPSACMATAAAATTH